MAKEAARATTPMSASCRLELARKIELNMGQRRFDGMRGFTLLEILVVLTLIGLLSALVVPNLQKLTGGVERATRRDGLVADIAGLSYRAFALGQGFELSDAKLGQLLSDGNPLFVPPTGWRVEVEAPVIYNFNGFCSGGRIKLIAPDANVEQLVLEAPVCRVSSARS